MIVPKMFALFVLPVLVMGCAIMPAPGNLPGAQYQPMQKITADAPQPCLAPKLPTEVSARTRVDVSDMIASPDRIGPGDRLKLTISGDADILTGTYVVGSNGRLAITDVGEVVARDRPLAALEADLRARFVQAQLVRDVPGNVKLALAEAAGVRVAVAGAVFEPGVVHAGERSADARPALPGASVSGDFNGGRTLSTALRAAGGLRPDAAVDHILLIRGDHYASVDLSPVFSGGDAPDPQLASGDHIIVLSLGCFQPELVRPTSVTVPGIRVFLSNLARPISGGQNEAGLPYGTRMLQALVAADCIGGSSMNASRQAVLLSHNPMTGQSVVIARSVEALVRGSGRDGVNPYLMPGDAIACYDSKSMTLVDAVSVVGSLLSPAMLVGIR